MYLYLGGLWDTAGSTRKAPGGEYDLYTKATALVRFLRTWRSTERSVGKRLLELTVDLYEYGIVEKVAPLPDPRLLVHRVPLTPELQHRVGPALSTQTPPSDP